MRNLKFLTLIALLAMIHLTAKAQPGILDVVLKTTNIQESIVLDKPKGGIVLISIFNSENQVVYQTKHLVTRSNKVFCELPKGIYKVVVTDLNNHNASKIQRISIE